MKFGMGVRKKNGSKTAAPSAERSGALGTETAVGEENLRLRLLVQPPKRVIADIVMLADFLAMSTLALVAQWIYLTVYLGSDQDELRYLTVGAAGAVVAVTTMRNQGIYLIKTLETLRGQNTRITFGLVVSLLVLLAAAYLLKVSEEYSRGWMTIWFGLTVPALFSIHALAAGVIRRWKSFGMFVRNVAIYGSDEVAQKLVEHLGAQRDIRRVVGVYDDIKPGITPKVVVSGGLSDLIRAGQYAHFDEVLIALPMAERERITNAVAQLSILPTNVLLCPDLLAFQYRPTSVVDCEGVSLLEMVPMPMDNWAPIVKATEDRILACIALALAMPIMILVAMAIKFDSPGPIFFRQRRHGFNHKVISVLKFRSMNVAQDGAFVPQAEREDLRVTRVGKILRKISLDELPQLINVLRGDMSLVGPRPHAISHNEHFEAVLEIYASRHKVKPGITGWAQINGFRGETDTSDKMRKRVEHDLYYIENWSLWLDLKILLLTPFSLFGKHIF